jgi:hypothetical protein
LNLQQALLPRLSEFLRVEKMFVGKLRDDVVREMTKANADNLSVVILENLAPISRKMRTRLVLALSARSKPLVTASVSDHSLMTSLLFWKSLRH